MMYVYVPEDCSNLSNSSDPDKIPPCAAFHQSLHCLPIFLISGIKNVKVLGDSVINSGSYMSAHVFFEFIKRVGEKK